MQGQSRACSKYSPRESVECQQNLTVLRYYCTKGDYKNRSPNHEDFCARPHLPLW